MLARSTFPVRPGSRRVRIDPSKRQAFRDGQPLSVSGLPFRILEILLESDGKLVTRAELKRMLWPYAERIDTERRLNTAVRALREALGDTAAKPGLIETVRKHGYRWLGAEQPRAGKPPFLQFAAAACLALIAAPVTLHGGGKSARATDSSPDRKLAWTYVNEGRATAALPHIATLLQSAETDKAETGWLLLRSGMPEAALASCGAAPDPTLNLLSCRQTALARLGLIADARAVSVELMRLAGADARLIGEVAKAPSAIGYRRFLRWRIDAFVRPNRDWFQRAQLQADAGMYDEALASLERAAATNDPLLVKIRSSAEFAPLHNSAVYRRIASAALGKLRIS